MQIYPRLKKLTILEICIEKHRHMMTILYKNAVKKNQDLTCLYS